MFLKKPGMVFARIFPYINELYDKCALFNGTKWLMVEVMDDDIFEDVKELIMLKTRK